MHITKWCGWGCLFLGRGTHLLWLCTLTFWGWAPVMIFKGVWVVQPFLSSVGGAHITKGAVGDCSFLSSVGGAAFCSQCWPELE